MSPSPTRISIRHVGELNIAEGDGFRQLTVEALPSVVLLRWEGRLPTEAYFASADVVTKSKARTGRVTLVGDGWDWQGYEPGFREAWTTWARAQRSTIDGLHILIRSSLIKMGVQVVNMAIGGLITAYTDRSKFERAVQQLHPGVDLSLISIQAGRDVGGGGTSPPASR